MNELLNTDFLTISIHIFTTFLLSQTSIYFIKQPDLTFFVHYFQTKNRIKNYPRLKIKLIVYNTKSVRLTHSFEKKYQPLSFYLC